MELLCYLICIQFMHCTINFIIMLMFLRFLCYHDRITLIILHDIWHIEGSIMRNPVIQNEHFLSHCLSTGFFYFRQCCITFCSNSLSIVFDTKLISIVKVLNHSHKIIETILTRSYIFNRHICQNQHLSQNSKSIIPTIIIREEEWELYTKYISISYPLILIVFPHSQNLLNLLFC